MTPESAPKSAPLPEPKIVHEMVTGDDPNRSMGARMEAVEATAERVASIEAMLKKLVPPEPAPADAAPTPLTSLPITQVGEDARLQQELDATRQRLDEATAELAKKPPTTVRLRRPAGDLLGDVTIATFLFATLVGLILLLTGQLWLHSSGQPALLVVMGSLALMQTGRTIARALSRLAQRQSAQVIADLAASMEERK